MEMGEHSENHAQEEEWEESSKPYMKAAQRVCAAAVLFCWVVADEEDKRM